MLKRRLRRKYADEFQTAADRKANEEAEAIAKEDAEKDSRGEPEVWKDLTDQVTMASDEPDSFKDQSSPESQLEFLNRSVRFVDIPESGSTCLLCKLGRSVEVSKKEKTYTRYVRQCLELSAITNYFTILLETYWSSILGM